VIEIFVSIVVVATLRLHGINPKLGPRL